MLGENKEKAIFYSLLFLDENHTRSVDYEKTKEGERLFFYPSFP
jgi:hypothetical protein